VSAAGWANAIRFVELAQQRDVLEHRLLGGTVPTLRLAIFLLAVTAAAPAPRERIGLGHLLLRVLEQLEGELQLVLAALQLRQLSALASHHRDEVLELGLLQQRQPAQPLDVTLMLNVEHVAKESRPIGNGKIISRHHRRRQHFLADKRAAFDEQRQLARREPHRRAAAVAPELGEASALPASS
jgi:hypothetical protein